jgi:cation diffusion facilitator family transporter
VWVATTGDTTQAAGPPAEQSLRSVLAALAANTAIAIAKGTAAMLTGSAALLAETLHSTADAGNELFLIVALRRSAREPDDRHPFGYGAERYFWALLAALGMFVIGGGVSVWQGVTELLEPTGVEAFWVGVAVLLISLVLDGSSRVVASREVRRRAQARNQSMRDYVRESADPTLTTVYLEDTADVIGAVLALIGLVVHQLTGSAAADALASIAIGGLLVYIAIRLASRNRDLLTNQAVPERYTDRLREMIEADDDVVGVPVLQAVYLGPREVLVTGEVRLRDGLDGGAVADAIARVREEIGAQYPQVGRWYLTPVR